MVNLSNTILTFLRNAWYWIIHFPLKALHLLAEMAGGEIKYPRNTDKEVKAVAHGRGFPKFC